MSRLPEKGEAGDAIQALSSRAEAAAVERDWKGSATFGNLMVGDGEVHGDTSSMLMVYGDLLDVGDLMKPGTGIVRSAMLSVDLGEQGLASGLASMLIQGVGIGVLMERARWEKRDAS